MRQYFPVSYSEFHTDQDGNPTGGVTMIFPGHAGEGTPISKGEPLAELVWQDGIESLNGRNGLFVEDVIEACLQRMRYFNDSKFRCRENSLAITKLEEAQQWLRQRQRNRFVEGKQSSYETHDS